ncbi:MAG TPA: PQQ-binding-like beta-propeller repeat protein [Verrucomicrobiae bacterium]|nr:PQQ-binding-like beta-propeller repeat protein [Verrucomicrobiae bacterium]
MRRGFLFVAICFICATQLLANNWPCFRGQDRTGIAPAGNDAVPAEWSDTQNIVWKTPLPGPGASSPIVWADSIYVTAFSGYGLDKNDPHSNMPKLVRHVLCIDRRNGTIRWKVNLPRTDSDVDEHGMGNFVFLHGYASSTPVADESGIYTYLGRAGVFAFDHDGRRRWHTPIRGRYHTWGSASSPILFENLLIVHADAENEGLFALDKQTGREVWRAATGEGDSWSTPLIVRTGTGHELVFHHSASQTGTAKVGAVNPKNGEALWECNILKNYLCPSPIADAGVIYWLAYQKSAAVRAGGRGDVTGSHVVWTAPRGSEVCTPIVHNGHLYWTSEDGGMAYCVRADSGALVYQERLQPACGRIYASGVLVGSRIYYVSRENGTYVVEAAPRFHQVAHNQIKSDTSIFNGTPAVSRGQLYLRSDGFLYCIGKK